MAKTEKQYVNVLFGSELLAGVDRFRFVNRFASRTEAIRWLIQAAMDKKLKPANSIEKAK